MAVSPIPPPAPRQPAARPFTWSQTLVLHLLPGGVITAGFVLLAWLTASLGWPPSLALLLTWLVLGIPLLVAILYRQGRQRRGTSPPEDVLLYRQPMSWREYAWLVPALLVWSAVASTLLFPLGETIRASLFPGWPEWLNLSTLAQEPARYSTRILWSVVALSAVLNVAVPITEELYFRSFLLPRIPASPVWAPAWSTVLFSLYHFWNPWDFFGRILALLPVVYAVQRRRNIYVSILVHCLLNLIGTAGLAAVILATQGR